MTELTFALPSDRRLVSNRLLAGLSLALLGAALLAIARGRADWPAIPLQIWLHLASILAATALTPVMLLRAKGTRGHRRLGKVWVAAMALTALTSLFVNARAHHGHNLGVFSGDFSPIHLLTVWVLIQVPLIVILARRRNVAGHERAVRGMVIGALLIAGFFTFPFDRLLGHWLFG